MRPSFVFLLLYISCSLSAQNDRMFAAGPGINGFGLAASLKLYKPVDNVSQLTKGDLLFELGNIQSRREVALINNALQSSGVYKFNKINYAWTLRSYYMFRKNIFPRPDRKSIALNAVGGVGLPIAYTWPVYILLYNNNTPGETFSEVRYDPSVHPQNLIGGRAPFTRGLSQGKFTPGLGLNTGLEFSWGNFRNDVKSVTMGVRLEGYARKLPIMYAATDSSLNRSLYSMFYLTFAFGFSHP
jgi:hypothetical protein